MVDVEIYVDLMSQPSRAVLVLAQANALPVKVCGLKIHKGEHRTDAFRAMNPLGQLPCLAERRRDTGEVVFCVAETGAVLRYLCARRFPGGVKVADHWHAPPRALSGDPTTLSEAQRLAYADAAVHWYHNTVRYGAAKLVLHKYLWRNIGVTPVEAIAEDARTRLDRALGQIERVWLGGGAHRFVGGAMPCVADILFASELEQLAMLDAGADGVDAAQILAPFPGVRAWLGDVKSACGPSYEDAHRVLRRAKGARTKALTKAKDARAKL